MMKKGNHLVKNLPEGLDVFYRESSHRDFHMLEFYSGITGEVVAISQPPFIFEDLEGNMGLRFSKEGAVRLLRFKRGDDLKKAEEARKSMKCRFGGCGPDDMFEYAVFKWNGEQFFTMSPFGKYDRIDPINNDGFAMVTQVDTGLTKKYPKNLSYGVANFNNGVDFTIPFGKHAYISEVSDYNRVCFSDSARRSDDSLRYGVLDVHGKILVRPIFSEGAALLDAEGAVRNIRNKDTLAMLEEEHRNTNSPMMPV